MGISYEDAVLAQEALEDELIKDTNVVSIGVVAETDDFGKKTGNYVVQVGIISDDASWGSVVQGKSCGVPREYVIPPKNHTNEEKHVPVKLVKQGQIQALNVKRESSVSKIRSSQDKRSFTDLSNCRAKVRPSPCGYSASHFSISAGTIGMLLAYSDGVNARNAYILSNNHIFEKTSPLKLIRRNYSTGFSNDSIRQSPPKLMTFRYNQINSIAFSHSSSIMRDLINTIYINKYRFYRYVL